MEFVQSCKTPPVESVYYTGYDIQTMRKLLIACLFQQLIIIVVKLYFIFWPWNTLY